MDVTTSRFGPLFVCVGLPIRCGGVSVFLVTVFLRRSGNAFQRKEGPGVGILQVPKIYNGHESALELVSGADFWCKLMFRAIPGDLGGSRGRFPA